MSLINDALKKAQKQRTGDNTPLAAMPGVGGESAARIAKRGKPVAFNSILLRLGLGAGAVLVLAIGGYFVLRGKPETGNLKPDGAPGAEMAKQISGAPSPAATPQVSGLSSQVSAPPAPPVAASQVSQPSTINSQPSTSPAPGAGGLASPKPSGAGGFTLPVVTPPPPTPVVQKTENREQRTVPPPAARPTSSDPAPSSVLRPPSSEPAKPAAPPAKLEPRAITFIESLRVAGIRASTTDSKVLMNDRVYRVGDIVEHEMGLKLTGITANSMTFEDEHGGRYTRQF